MVMILYDDDSLFISSRRRGNFIIFCFFDFAILSDSFLYYTVPVCRLVVELLLHSFSENAQSRDCAAHFRKPIFVQMESARNLEIEHVHENAFECNSSALCPLPSAL